MTTGILRHKVLLDTSSATTGDWFRLDNRYGDLERAIQLSITSGDTITIQATTKDVRGSDKETVTASLDTDDIVDLEDFTASGGYTLEGPWTYIRAKKTGTTGNAKVQGMI